MSEIEQLKKEFFELQKNYKYMLELIDERDAEIKGKDERIRKLTQLKYTWFQKFKNRNWRLNNKETPIPEATKENPLLIEIEDSVTKERKRYYSEFSKNNCYTFTGGMLTVHYIKKWMPIIDESLFFDEKENI